MGAVLPVLLLLHLAASRTDTGIRLLTKDSELERNAPGAAGRAAAPLPPGLGGGGGEAIAGFFFQPWLDADLAPWAVTGISEALVRAAHKKARVCWGGLGPEGALRATIISGALWAVLDPPGPGGHYAAQLGPGWASGKGRIPYALLSIVDALREAPPGGVPDTDFVMQIRDTPCIKWRQPGWLAWWRRWRPPLPVFGYSAAAGYADVPVPDFGWLGHEMLGVLDGPDGTWLWGWEAQRRFLTDSWHGVPLAERQPQAVWRGRSNDRRRDRLRQQLLECHAEAEAEGRHDDAHLLNLQGQQVGISEACGWRYQLYLEAGAYSGSLRKKLACGSLLLMPRPRFNEFWSRALEPGVHYVEIGAGGQSMCRDLVATVRRLNAAVDNSTGRGQPADTGGPATRQHLPPQQIADNAQQLLERHLSLPVVRQYWHALLQSYSRLLLYRPRPPPDAVCITGRRLLDLFGVPHTEDRQLVSEQFPWLAAYDPGCPPTLQRS